MPDSQTVPNTESVFVASLALAWEIAKTTQVGRLSGDMDAQLIQLTNAVIKAYVAISNAAPITK